MLLQAFGCEAAARGEYAMASELASWQEQVPSTVEVWSQEGCRFAVMLWR
jgi:hypothetical protein